MKTHIKLDENYFLTTNEIQDINQIEKIPQKTNHIFVVDVSYSMMYDLDLIKKQLKNKLSTIMNEGDTITIVWFSGKNDAGILKEEVEVKSLKTLDDLNNAIDKWLKPIGLTAFLKPLTLVEDIIKRIEKNRPDSIFSMIFLTDGYNNNCSWTDVINALTKIEDKIISSTFVEYGFYADTNALIEMAKTIGGEKISCNGFDEFEPVFNEKISSPILGKNKKSIEIDDNYLYDFAFAINNGSLILYNISNNKISVGSDISEIHYFSSKLNGEHKKTTDTILYSAIYVLADKILYNDAEKIFYVLGDNYHYNMLIKSFGKQKLNAFKNAIKECIIDKNKRHPNGIEPINPIDDNAYCLINFIDDLSKFDNCLFYPNHQDFTYNRIGRKRKIKGSNFSEADKQKILEANNIEEVNNVLNELKEKNVDLKFIETDKQKGYPLSDFVWNKNRANLSVRIRIDGNVILPKNKFDLNEITSFKYRTFNIIRDGILNVDKLPIKWTKELDDFLINKGIQFNRSVRYDSESNIGQEKFLVVYLSSLPIINRNIVNNVWGKNLAKLEWELMKLRADKKVFDYYKNKQFPKISKTYVDMVGRECAEWLKEIGITDYNGFTPKTELVDSEDYYMSIELLTKIKGLSKLPKVIDVVKKNYEKKSLNISEKIMINAINEYSELINTVKFKNETHEKQREIIETFLNKKSTALNQIKGYVMGEIAKIKFALILSKKWFKEFESFDDNKLSLNFNGIDLDFTFELKENLEKI